MTVRAFTSFPVAETFTLNCIDTIDRITARSIPGRFNHTLLGT